MSTRTQNYYAEVPPSERLRHFLSFLTCFKVKAWGQSSQQPHAADREVAPVDEAHVVSSLRTDGRHAIVLDIDHDSWLVKSSTPGHYHLYIDVPDGIPVPEWFTLMRALANAGVIEDGYMRASLDRGHSDVRLPWIKKGAEQPASPVFIGNPTATHYRFACTHCAYRTDEKIAMKTHAATLGHHGWVTQDG